MPPRQANDAAQAHSAAVEMFLAAARAIPDAAWERPMARDKWSPAQVAEHLRLTYALVQNQLSGGSGIRIRTPWLMRTLLRWRMLPRILSSGTLPEGARAPREIRPGDGPFQREPVLQALQVAARNVEENTRAPLGRPELPDDAPRLRSADAAHRHAVRRRAHRPPCPATAARRDRVGSARLPRPLPCPTGMAWGACASHLRQVCRTPSRRLS